MVYRLILSHLKKSYTHTTDSFTVLDDLSYTFSSGQTYGISGRSGSGKTTLLHILAGLDTPTAGNVTLQGSTDSFLQRCGIIFQMPYLINELTVVENVIIKSLIENQSYAKAQEHGILLLEKVGLKGKQDAYPAQLSGGQQQRVALARALCNKPTFIVADEPTSNLDEVTGTAILDLLLLCQQEWQFGLLVCSHDQYVLDRMQTVLELKDGKLFSTRSGCLPSTRHGEQRAQPVVEP